MTGTQKAAAKNLRDHAPDKDRDAFFYPALMGMMTAHPTMGGNMGLVLLALGGRYEEAFDKAVELLEKESATEAPTDQ